MNAPARPQLVVTVPARSVAEARRAARAARDAGADLAEIRLDLWPPAERERAGELFPAPLPLVATVRSRAEGGEGPDDPAERAAVLAAAARLPFAYLDRERLRDPMPAEGREDGPLPVESSHLPAGTTVAAAQAIWTAPSRPGAVRKVVLPAPVGVALTELVPALHRDPPPPGTSVMTTGPSGPLLRALGARLGSAWVYARLPESATSAPPIEPSQLAVDDLARFFSGPADAPLFALLGRPVAGSPSPRLHGTWMRRQKVAGIYLPLEIASADELAAALRLLPELGFRGANVTHPWKEAALRLAARATPIARQVGVANCLRFDPDGPLADNTDVAAAEQRLGELRAAGRWDGETVAVVGSGGAARATVGAARRLGARAVVYGRNRGAVDRIVRDLGADPGDPAAPHPARLAVHATTVGRAASEPLAVPIASVVAPGGYLLDWVYGAPDGEVAQAAARARAAYEGGDRLLAYQAAESYERWWGLRPPPPDVFAATEGSCAE